MSTLIPDSHKDLVSGGVYTVFTTVSPSGQPENTVVWCSWDGENVLVNTTDGRRKAENIKKNPKVAVLAIDTKNPYRWIDVRGTVDKITEDTDLSNINRHCFLYTGQEEYYGSIMPAEAKGTEKRLILHIKPERVVAFPPGVGNKSQ